MSRVVHTNIWSAYGYARKAGYEGTEEEFEEGMKKSAEAAENAEESASTASEAATEANAARDAAAQSAESASTSEGNALEYANSAAQVLRDAQAVAQTVNAKANEAAGSASRAENYAQTATTKASEATTAAGTATTAASSASGSAQAADASATAAAASETNAAASASSASTSAWSASESADDAAASAAEAQAVKDSIPADYTALSDEVTDLKSQIKENHDEINFKDYGKGIIPTNPAYVQYINPSLYTFTANYLVNNIYTCVIVSDSTGARTVGFNQTNSTGFEPVDLTGKVVRVSHNINNAHDNVMYLLSGISDDGSAYHNWQINLNAQETGEFVFDADTFISRTGYKNLFIVGFYFNGSSIRTTGEIYQFTVEIADANEVENGWNLTERIEKQIETVGSEMQKIVYDFSDIHIKGINHRGFNSIAPENTLPAFRLSKQKGFDFVETDVEKTADGVYVLLHDSTINRTARNADGTALSTTINIADITYSQALTYDFGIWKNAAYAGTKIPTFEEFIVLCGKIGLYCYIELKQGVGLTETDIQNLIAIVNKYHMEKRVTWISFSWQLQKWVHDNDPDARVGWLGTNMPLTVPQTIKDSLTNGRNEAFIDANISGLTTEFIDACNELSIKIEVYCPNTASAMLTLDNYITGATSDILNFEDVLYNGNIGESDTGIQI